MDFKIPLITLFFCFYANLVSSVSIYSWTLTGRKFCLGNATKDQTESLLKCDKLMRPERKKLLEVCLKETVNYVLTDDKPRVCSYSLKEDNFKVMDCMYNRTGSFYGKEFLLENGEENFDAIDEAENEFEWCLMKLGSVYGFEHLCVNTLNAKQITEIKNCRTNATNLIDMINGCRTEAKLKLDNRPAICDYFQSINVIKCWNKKSTKWSESFINEIWNQYIECLTDIPK